MHDASVRSACQGWLARRQRSVRIFRSTRQLTAKPAASPADVALARQGRAIAYLLGAVLLFAALDSAVKWLSSDIPVPLLVWGRYTTHLLLMLVFLWPRLGRGLVRAPKLPLQVLRGAMLLGTTTFGFLALARMPVAEATAVFFSAPLMVALLAGPWLGEKISLGRWLAALAGFAGILLIARPGSELPVVGIALSLAGAVCYALYQLLTRQLAAHTPPLTLLFYTALLGSAGATLGLPWFWPATWPAAGDLLAIAGLGVLGGGGHFLLIHAFRNAPASLLSPFLYVQLLWATLLGGLLFAHWPDAWSLAGMGVIIASGLWLGVDSRRQ